MLIVDVTIAELFLRSLRCKPCAYFPSTPTHQILVGEAPVGVRELGGCYAIEGSKIIFIDFCTLIVQETGW